MNSIYAIQHYPSCTDFAGNYYPNRWQVIARRKWRRYDCIQTYIEDVSQEYTSKDEAEAFLNRCRLHEFEGAIQ